MLKKISIMLILVLALSASMILSDIKITSTSKTSAFMNRPAKEEKTITYISDIGLYLKKGEDLGILFTAKDSKLYYLLKTNKQYMEVDWKKVDSQYAAYVDYFKDTQTEVKNLGKKEMINKWNTTIWKMTVSNKFSNTDITFYQSEDIKLPMTYYKAMETMLKLQPTMNEAVMKELKNMKGYPVKQIVKVKTPQGDLEISSIVTEIEEKELKPTLFEISSDYRKIDFDLQKLNQMAM
jgi:hypothetical protein